jgi:hypothetical protein
MRHTWGSLSADDVLVRHQIHSISSRSQDDGSGEIVQRNSFIQRHSALN